MNQGFTDLHHHLVYDLDDGPRCFNESIQMVQAAREDGIQRIIATTHVYPGLKRFNFSLYLKRLKEVQEWCLTNEPLMHIFPGAEIFYTDAAVRLLQSGEIQTLANTHFVLVEFDVKVTFEKLFQAVRQLQKAGYLAILAHIERYECLVKEPRNIFKLKQTTDVRFQINGNTMIRTPFQLRKFLHYIFEEDLLDYIATDAHNTNSRAVCMAKAHAEILSKYGLKTADELCGLRQDEVFQN